jgi:hypothetical protein
MRSSTEVWQGRIPTTISQKRWRRHKLEDTVSLPTDKRSSPWRNYDYCKHIHTKCWYNQFHKTNTTGHKDMDRSQHSNRRWLPYPILTNRSSTQKNQHKNIMTKWHCRSNGLNRHEQNIWFNSHRMHILLSSPQTFIQNRSYLSRQKVLTNTRQLK